MEVFAVQTYFSTEFLAFFETLLQIRRPVLVGKELVENVSFSEMEARSPVPPSAGVTGASPPGGDEGNGARSAAKPGTAAAPSPPPARGPGFPSSPSPCSTVPPTGQFDMLRVESRKLRGRRYDALARELIVRGAMPLGLYRPAGTKGSSLPYTQVNPCVSERLVDGDEVFVLRSRSCSLVGSV